MRVLFATYAVKTHFQAMVPLAWALRNAGHEVRVASQPELVDIITGAGLTAVSVGRDHNLWRSANRFLTKRFAELHPEVHERVRSAQVLPFDLAEQAPEQISWDYLLPAYQSLVQSWYQLANGSMIGDLVRYCRQWQPDLVLWEPNTYAAPIAAKACGAASARMLWGLDIFAVTRARFLELKSAQPEPDRGDPLAEWLGAHMRRYGAEFSEELITGDFTIDQLPGPLRMTADLHYLRMRYVPYNGTAVVPRWLWDPPRRPRIALTLGITSAESFGGYGVGVQEILDSLADLDLEIVATVAAKEQHKLRQPPANTRIVETVPLHALMPSCAAAIHHAGFGTLCTTLVYGVPPLSLPERFDEPALARRVAGQGAGFAVPMAEATGAKVRDRLLRLLDEPAYRQRVEPLRAEMLALPTPSDLVPHLEKLAAQYCGR